MKQDQHRNRKIIIYYRQWTPGTPSSHELLMQALSSYLRGYHVRSHSILEQKEPDASVIKMSPKYTVINGNEHGKPMIREYPDIHFSISHSGLFWTCAFYDQEIGLDLQKYDVRKWEGIPARFFHPDESAWMEGRSREEFCRIWAYKESYVKYTGKGLSQGLDTFSILSSNKQMLKGASDVCQQEVPFPESGYAMVVTTAEPADLLLYKFAPKGRTAPDARPLQRSSSFAHLCASPGGQ